MQTANTELCAAKEQALVALREKEEALKVGLGQCNDAEKEEKEVSELTEKLVEALSSSHD